MPFTLAHAAAALPFRRLRLNMPALIVGTFAPDFEYFLRLAPSSGFGHSLIGVFVLSLPLALLTLSLFQHVVEIPLISLLPDAIQGRLLAPSDRTCPSRLRGYAVTVGSALLGIMTHIIWDSFTHLNTWTYRHWPFLSQTVWLPVVGSIPHYKVFQHGSTVVGIVILAVWFSHWYKNSAPVDVPLGASLPQWRRVVIVAVVLIVAAGGALVRVVVGAGGTGGGFTATRSAGEGIVTFIALIWWELVAYGLYLKLVLPKVRIQED